MYMMQQLLPSLVDFWHNMVVPAFEQRDRMGMESVQFGWIPEHLVTAAAKRKADGQHPDGAPPPPGPSPLLTSDGTQESHRFPRL